MQEMIIKQREKSSEACITRTQYGMIMPRPDRLIHKAKTYVGNLIGLCGTSWCRFAKICFL